MRDLVGKFFLEWLMIDRRDLRVVDEFGMMVVFIRGKEFRFE